MENSSWAAKKKLQYTIGFMVIFFLLFGLPAILIIKSLFYTPPSCFDGKQNQDERGIDCGGGCLHPCVGETQDLEVSWSRTLMVEEGVYDIAARIDNPNPNARLDNFDYTIKVFGKSDILLYEKDGSDYADAGERFIIFESGVRLGGSIPVRTTLEIHEPLEWLQSGVETTMIKTGKKELIHSENGSRLDVFLQHYGVVGAYENVDIYAVVSDITGKPVGVSRTYVKDLLPSSDKTIFFTWPVSLKEQTRGLCEDRANLPKELLVPSDVMLVFDRSGSMNNDGADPPQPISDAKEAAVVYIQQMMSVDHAGLVSFATESSSPIDQKLTGNTQDLTEAIEAITIGIPDNEQHTNLGDGIKKALEELQKNGREKAKKAIIALTDGVASRPFDPIDPSNEAYAENYATLQAAQARKDDVFLYVIGLGSDLNENLLAYSVASSPENYYNAASSDELANIYSDIAKAVCEEDVFLYEIFIRVQDNVKR